MDNFSIVFRLFISAALGGLIGLERQLHRRAAGLRTHILVSMGSALIMLTSMYIFDIYKDKVALDPARLAAGVITGIGFLGAGTIIRYGTEVRGLTTAASLWVVAAVGLATGCGFYVASVSTTLIVLLVLFALRSFEQKILNRRVSTTAGHNP